MPGPLTYTAMTARTVLTKPTLPTLGAAGTIIHDPTFGSRILRVSDANTEGGKSIRTLGGAGNTQAWNADGTRFITTDTSGGCQLWTFNAATMQAAFVKSLNFNASTNATFSLIDPDAIYGFSTSFVEATVTKYRMSIDSYSTVVGVRTLVPTVDDGGRTYMDAVTLGADANGIEYLSFVFGGGGQDRNFYAFWGPLNNLLGAGKILNTRDSTINGVASSPLGIFLHSAFVDMSGRYVGLSPSESILGSFGSPVPVWFFWDTTTNAIVLVSGANYPGPDSGGGHAASGFGTMCNFPDDNDGFDSKYRALATPHAWTQLVSPFPSPSDFQIANHASWSNADPARLVPVIAAWYRYPTGSGPSSFVPNTKPWRTWDDEVLAVSTDGSGIVYRLCHHRSDVNDRNDALFDWFWSLPRPNVSNDGRWAMFTSNWEFTLGQDAQQPAFFRQDTFIVALATGLVAPTQDQHVQTVRAGLRVFAR